ncbi:MAG: ATP-binding protein [Anaerolineaceae bacterium]
MLSGLPGTGKTTFAHALSERLAFEHVESDAIRRGLGPRPTYTADESAAVFARAEAMARAALEGGRHALLDATNLTQRDRKRFVRLAQNLEAPIVAVRVTAPDPTIRRRLHSPRQGFSQAGVDTYERMRERGQPFEAPAVVIDTRYPLGPSIDLVLGLIHDGGND